MGFTKKKYVLSSEQLLPKGGHSATFKRTVYFLQIHKFDNSNDLADIKNQRTNGPVNAHLISWPTKAQNIQNLLYMVKK